MRRALLLLTVAGLLSGCLAGEPAAGGACPRAGQVATPALDGKYMQTDPGQAWQTVVYTALGEGSSLATAAWSATAGWTATAEPIGANATAGRFDLVTVEPHGRGRGNATWSFELQGPSGCGREKGTVTWDLAAPHEGMSAQPGQGVHVMTAGFLEDGTLFYTNIPEIDTDPRWPRVSWYQWEGDRPLPVYVYAQDRSEQPDHWKGTYNAVSKVPPTGTPADDAVRKEAAAFDEDHGVGYFTTITGFNQALKGLSSATTRVVHMAPEQGYTRPGNEEHPLYGHALVFYIKVLDVVDAPCPAETPTLACSTDVLPTIRS